MKSSWDENVWGRDPGPKGGPRETAVQAPLPLQTPPRTHPWQDASCVPLHGSPGEQCQMDEQRKKDVHLQNRSISPKEVPAFWPSPWGDSLFRVRNREVGLAPPDGPFCCSGSFYRQRKCSHLRMSMCEEQQSMSGWPRNWGPGLCHASAQGTGASCINKAHYFAFYTVLLQTRPSTILWMSRWKEPRRMACRGLLTYSREWRPQGQAAGQAGALGPSHLKLVTSWDTIPAGTQSSPGRVLCWTGFCRGQDGGGTTQQSCCWISVQSLLSKMTSLS